MVHVMPGLTSPRFHDPSASAAWFRLSPSGAFLACALAKHMLKVGVTRASPVVDPDDYSNNFATMFGSLFSSKGGTLLPTVQMDPRSASHADTFSNLARLSPDAIALVTSPSAAAGFLQEWAVRNKPVDVYLGPTLNSPELLRNVPLGILEGISGVSADLGSQSSTFESFLLARTKVPSIAGSHYYFDSVALLALAVAEGIAQTGVLPPPSAMMAHMLSLTSPGGTLVGFDQLAQGLGLLAAGQKIEYQGAAGAYVLNALGDSTYNRGAIWQIKGTAFESIDYEQCEVSELQNGSYPGTEF
jgi:ABC-type branched-subunit amino acid transport system substrate-binding protein